MTSKEKIALVFESVDVGMPSMFKRMINSGIQKLTEKKADEIYSAVKAAFDKIEGSEE